MKRPPVYLRASTADDYRFCYDLLRKNMLVLFTRHWGGWNPKTFHATFSLKRTKIIMIGSRRYGFLTVRKDPDSLYIENIQLSYAVRGKGIGTQVLTDFLDKNAKSDICLTTFTDNPALALYKRLGFKITKKDKGTLRMKKEKVSP